MNEAVEGVCSMCGVIFTLSKYQATTWKKSGRALCGAACRSARSSEVMASTNRKYASARMTLRNPMSNPEWKAKAIATCKRLGVKPTVRGGNGTGPTKSELLLAFASGLSLNVVVPTKVKRGNGYPTCYKLDMGDEDIKFGVEVDGFSHGLLSRQAQDRKKELFLGDLGWTIMRFSNQQVNDDLQTCVTKISDEIARLYATKTFPSRSIGAAQEEPYSRSA